MYGKICGNNVFQTQNDSIINTGQKTQKIDKMNIEILNIKIKVKQ